MKIFQILLVGFLSTSYQQSPTSSATQPKADDKWTHYKTNENLSKELTLLRISNAISAHVRLIHAFESYSVLMQPGNMDETVQEAVSMFFFVNETTANALLKVDASYAGRIIDELKRINTEGVDVENATIAVDQLLEIYDQLHDLPPLAEKSETFQLPPIVEGSKELDVKKLDKYKTNIDAIQDCAWPSPPTPAPSPGPPPPRGRRKRSTVEETTKKLVDAAEAIEGFHAETEMIVGQIKRFTRIHDVLDVIDPIKKKINIYNSLVDVSTDNLKQLNSLTSIMKQMPSFETVSRVSAALVQLTVENDNSKLANQNLLKNDLNDVDFGFWLNDAGNTTRLKKVLEPYWSPAKKVSELAQNVKQIAQHQETMEKINKINNLMMTASNFGQSADDFNLSLVSLHKMLKESTPLPQEISDDYNNITEGLVDYLKFHKTFDNFLALPDYAKLASDAKLGQNMRSLVAGDALDGIKAEAKEASSRFSTVLSWLTNLTKDAGRIEKSFKSHTLENFITNAEKWTSMTFKNTVRELEKHQKDVLRAKSGIDFVKLHQSISSLDSFPSDVKKIQEAIQMFKEGIISSNGELEHLPDESNYEKAYYQYMIYLKDHYHPKDKMTSGAILFELFHRFINGSTFDDMLTAGEELGKKIHEIQINNETRYDLVLQMKKFNTIKDRIIELKHQVLLRKGRYDGVPMDELIDLRWLIENLHDVPNPEFKRQEWMGFAEKVGLDKAGDFKKSLENTFDLDYAAHQKQVIDTYKNYRALVRYNKAVLNIEKSLARSFYERYRPYIDFGILIACTILFNVGLYGTAIWKMKKDEKREMAEEKEMEYMYQKYLMNMANAEIPDHDDDDKD